VRVVKAALAALPLAASIALAGAAHAQDNKPDATKECAPGDWFCGDTKPPAANGDSKGDLQPLPGDTTDGKPADAKGADNTPPPVVVYHPPPSVVVQPRAAPPPYYYVPRKAKPRKEWGLNLHLGGLMIGKGQQNNAGMGLVGLGFRFRPIPQAGLEADLDFAAGRDYNGFRRNETALSFNGIIWVNPKNKTQVYFLGGFGWSVAKAVDDRAGFDQTEYHYGYFGVQTGVGLEFRLSKVVALNVDLRGFIRGRVDDNRRYNPEFVDGDGRSTNTSGGGLLSGGLTFYW
jgi:hypothetical protein